MGLPATLGNRTRRTVGTTVEDYFYGDDDELTEIKIGSTVVKSFGYDGAGRRTSATYSGVTTNYAYDYESRITSITRTGVTTNSFAYNGLDTRVSKTDSAGTTSYKRAGAYVTDALLKSTVSSTTTDYTPGVSSRVGSDSTFLHSGIKNADTQTDDGGDVSAMHRYDAFGNPVAAWGGWQGPFGYGGPYGYQTDPDHGLMLLGHRYYEADTGRFLTRDPIKDGRNWYGYCGGSPVTHCDPFGLQKSYLQQVGEVGLGYLDALNPWEWVKGGYETGKLILGGLAKGDLMIGPKVSGAMILEMIEGVFQTEDPRRFGRSIMGGLLLSLPFGKGVRGANRGGLGIVAEPPLQGKPGYTGGKSVPDPAAGGAHTTLRSETGRRVGEYRQGFVWDRDGNLIGRVDVTDHGRIDHTNPHFHRWRGPQLGWGLLNRCHGEDDSTSKECHPME